MDKFGFLVEFGSHSLASAFKALDARDIPVYMTLPVCSLRLNPVEECWRQLQEALNNWSIGSHSELPTAIDAALGQLSHQILINSIKLIQ